MFEAIRRFFVAHYLLRACMSSQSKQTKKETNPLFSQQEHSTLPHPTMRMLLTTQQGENSTSSLGTARGLEEEKCERGGKHALFYWGQRGLRCTNPGATGI
jgi:hypothetical protein